MAIKPNLPSGKGSPYKGEVQATTKGSSFAKPYEEVDVGIMHMQSLHNDIGEKSGFQADTSGYIVKKGTIYGEAAKLNIMPPGMDISDQPMRDIREMPLKFLVKESFAGDGWEPSPRDIPE